MTPTIDLNADLGEGFGRWSLGDDEGLLSVITSANVACGFHAGDPTIMRRVCALAVAGGVAIGAQVGYPDLVGFGRRHIEMDQAELRDAVLYQLGALEAMAQAAGGSVAYLKPHGALYHAVSRDDRQALGVLEALRTFRPDMPVLGLPGSRFLTLAEQAGVATVGEAFADRGYQQDGSLVARSAAGALVTDQGVVVERSVRFARDRVVRSVDGVDVEVEAASICVHGDTPGAVELAQAVRRGLEAAGLAVAPFVR